ncbi:hypothetical protein, partial [Frankia sp. Cr1]|uniref:hypothetical protein n=1 Tax=Frankia sp. Cr1 TaxID=3073931 RepID=UPI002AD436A8
MSLFGHDDPLDGLPRPTGDPFEVRRLAEQYLSAARGLADAASLLRQGVAGTVGGAWIGEAATST